MAEIVKPRIYHHITRNQSDIPLLSYSPILPDAAEAVLSPGHSNN
jgi:hypothetical protein